MQELERGGIRGQVEKGLQYLAGALPKSKKPIRIRIVHALCRARLREGLPCAGNSKAGRRRDCDCGYGQMYRMQGLFEGVCFRRTPIRSQWENAKCDMCLNQPDLSKEFPPCVETCPTNALKLGKMEAKEKLAVEQDIQKLMAM